MRHLLETGILVRVLDRADPLNVPIRDAIRRLLLDGHHLVAARQNVVEFWSVCTRPATARGGMGLSIEETARRLRHIERFVEVLNEPDSVYRHWKRLVIQHQVSGRQVHDARIVAVMTAYRIKRLVTLNSVDFVRFPAVTAISPGDV